MLLFDDLPLFRFMTRPFTLSTHKIDVHSHRLLVILFLYKRAKGNFPHFPHSCYWDSWFNRKINFLTSLARSKIRANKKIPLFDSLTGSKSQTKHKFLHFARLQYKEPRRKINSLILLASNTILAKKKLLAALARNAIRAKIFYGNSPA